MASLAIGRMTEHLVIQRNDPPSLSVSSLTRSSTTATATTTVPHGYLVGDYCTFAGSLISGWNSKFKLVSVPSTTTFTFTCSGSLTSPATGTITVTYTSNASGGSGSNGSVYRTAWTENGEPIPIGANERLQIAAVHSTTLYRFRVYRNAERVVTMRVLWTPRAPSGATRKTLEITGVFPCDDPRFEFMELAA